MMTGSKSTIRSRELGDELRHAMEKANLSGKNAAHLLGWSESKVSRMLTGHQAVKEPDIAALLALCLVKGDEKERLLELAREYNQRGWLQQHASRLPEQLRTLINQENLATQITVFDALRIPGLLQTSDYAQALIERIATIAPDKVESLVSARISRQSLFSRDHRPDFTFYLHEFALRLPVGGPAVMSAQLHQLLQMSVRRYITIRVIPTSFGALPTLDNSCRLVEFAEVKPVVYVEEQTAGNFMEDSATVAAYRKIFQALADCAMDEGESKELIAALAIDLYG
jgi:transcriptional regulator with XRE-family HTH domain